GKVGQAPNVISGNKDDGILLEGLMTRMDTVVNNYIGTTAAGLASVAGQGFGILIRNNAGQITITDNIVSGNGSAGVKITGGGNNELTGNWIGLSKDGTGIGNGLVNAADGWGVAIHGSPNNSIGTPTGARNVISANQQGGVLITGDASKSNIVAN